MKFTFQLAVRRSRPLFLAWILIALVIPNGCSDSNSKSKAQSSKGALKQTASEEQNKINNETVAKYKKAIELNPNDAEAHYFLGLTYYAKGTLDDAIAELQASLRLNSDNADAHYNLACAYSLKNEKAQAIKHLGQAIRLNPSYIRGAQMDPDLSNIKESEEFQTLVKKK